MNIKLSLSDLIPSLCINLLEWGIMSGKRPGIVATCYSWGEVRDEFMWGVCGHQVGEFIWGACGHQLGEFI